MKIPYIKIPITDMYAYLAPYPAQTKGQIFEAVLHYGMYQTWPALDLLPNQTQAYYIVQQMIEREIQSYKKFCKEQKQKIKKYWNKTKNTDDTNVLPPRNNQSKQETKQETKQKQEAKQEQENINISLTARAKAAQGERDFSFGNPKKALPAGFVDPVIARFESAVKTPAQKRIFIKNNARYLQDILDFCDHNIPLALQTINVCAERLAKGGVTGGYSAVCRNLPEYYEQAKVRLAEQTYEDEDGN